MVEKMRPQLAQLSASQLPHRNQQFAAKNAKHVLRASLAGSDRPSKPGLPLRTPCAPNETAFAMSVPRRTPLSISTAAR